MNRDDEFSLPLIEDVHVTLKGLYSLGNRRQAMSCSESTVSSLTSQPAAQSTQATKHTTDDRECLLFGDLL